MQCSAGQGTYILCSKGLQAQYSSSKQYTTHYRDASIRIEKTEKWCCNIFICMLAGILFGEKNLKNGDGLGDMQLGWGPELALGQDGRMFGQFQICQGCSAFQQILICRPPCNSQFLILIVSSS